MLILGGVIAACAGVEPTPTLAPAETPGIKTPAQAATPTGVVPIPNTAPATSAPSLTIKPLPGPTATAAPLTYPPVPASTPLHPQTPIDPKADCVAPTAGEGTGSVQEMANGHGSGSVPDTYALKVQVETTSLWTSVEVTGVESITSKYAITPGDGEINVDIDGLKVYDLSRPEGDPYQNQKVVLEIDAIIQKEDDTAVFRIRKERSGTTIYQLFSGNGNSTKEIARFTNDGTDNGDNLRTFVLELSALPSPISFQAANERYKGPLFDAPCSSSWYKGQGTQRGRRQSSPHQSRYCREILRHAG